MRTAEAKTRELVHLALAEDLGPELDLANDLTGQLAGGSQYDQNAEGHIAAREDGILAGTRAAELTFLLLAEENKAEIEINWLAKEGDPISPASPVAKIKGSFKILSAAERTSLNFLSHLSGIATLTNKFVRAVSGKTQIFDTRKTTPGFRFLEKSAVLAGGGQNHRFSLSDLILIKDNHLTRTNIEDAIREARAKHPDIFLEVECDTGEQVKAALSAGANGILLDNMAPQEIPKYVEMAKAENPEIVLEASGGITLENISAFAETGVDRISVGAITKSAPALDMGLDINFI